MERSQVFTWVSVGFLVVGLSVVAYGAWAGFQFGVNTPEFGVSIGVGIFLLLIALSSWMYSGEAAVQEYMKRPMEF